MNRFHITFRWSMVILGCYTIILSIIIAKTITKDAEAEAIPDNSHVPTIEELL